MTAILAIIIILFICTGLKLIGITAHLLWLLFKIFVLFPVVIVGILYIIGHH